MIARGTRATARVIDSNKGGEGCKKTEKEDTLKKIIHVLQQFKEYPLYVSERIYDVWDNVLVS